jgi:tRNA pseudouridine38-40 synthase
VKTYRLLVGYDGTAFHGWQVQPGTRTVQGVIEDAVRDLLGVDDVRVSGAGRTDAGVHARGQVASFEAETALPLAAIQAELGRRVPDDVRIGEVREEAPGFQARHSASSRRYSYRLLERDDVLWSRFAWKPALRWNRDGLAAATEALEGEHDFAAFESTGSSETVTRVRLECARWSEWEGGVKLDIRADHFLYHMVRNIVGTALQRSTGPDPAGELRRILESRDRSAAGLNAPPQGLCLEEVLYERTRA